MFTLLFKAPGIAAQCTNFSTGLDNAAVPDQDFQLIMIAMVLWSVATHVLIHSKHIVLAFVRPSRA